MVYIRKQPIEYQRRFAILSLIGGLFIAGSIGYLLAHSKGKKQSINLIDQWHQEINIDKSQLQNLQQQTEKQLQVLAKHIGKVEANLMRINALGERLVEYADLDPNEFDFNSEPGVGGPVTDMISETNVANSLVNQLKSIEHSLEMRLEQMAVLQNLFKNKLRKEELILAGWGKPVSKGWVSSFFGYRTDPFSGKRLLHAGVDVAGECGTQIMAVASGVVNIAEDRGAYGKLIEINHGDGFATRYAHNKDMFVSAGDLVRKGQAIATMGSSGRSTGPHVHFEVRKDGAPVDPGRYFADLRKKHK